MKMRVLLLAGLMALPGLIFADKADSLTYVDAAQFPLIGKGFNDTETRYERLPARLKGVTRPPVWSLGKNSSGLAIRFRSNSPVIGARWTVLKDVKMNHFAPTGIKGLDLYALNDGAWHYVRTGRPADTTTQAVIIDHMSGEMREYLLYLPLYDGLVSLAVGIDPSATIEAPAVASPVTGRPVVVYGTSITQGGCATRPGMSYTNILSRMLNREVINLGFSGNGKLDLEIAEAMAEIPASCFVMDCLPNVNEQLINDNYVRFIEILRAKHPETPIIMVENIIYPYISFDENSLAFVKKKNAMLAAIYKDLKKKGDKKLYYVKADKLIGSDGETTVDGVHLTDLGFQRMAQSLYPMVKRRIKRD